MLRMILLAASHLAMLALGFMAGIYTLPILIAAKGPDAAAINDVARTALFTARFERGLKGSDFLHWGEGEVTISKDRIAHSGRLAPGPDYKVYLSPEFVDTKDAFLRAKSNAVQIGDVKSFNGFVLTVPVGVDVTRYTAVVVWCETFKAFITAAKYR